tara:strand:- start:74851 stop:74997 length:147 start_codon:yes stop_codon:yes gene_type:complete
MEKYYIYDTLYASNMLFHKKTKKILKYFSIAIGILIIISMTLMFSPIF